MKSRTKKKKQKELDEINGNKTIERRGILQ
jgi:hypothetical protein